MITEMLDAQLEKQLADADVKPESPKRRITIDVQIEGVDIEVLFNRKYLLELLREALYNETIFGKANHCGLKISNITLAQSRKK